MIFPKSETLFQNNPFYEAYTSLVSQIEFEWKKSLRNEKEAEKKFDR
ncbi:MAG: hypothetical protein WCJ84_03080 [Candidatus Peregrinibacteria bacterium]